MFDFFRMPMKWPGREEARKKGWTQRGSWVEQALLADVRVHAGEDFRDELFLPYVQVHEFEALLFADVSKFAEALETLTMGPAGSLEQTLSAILQAAQSPEAINDGDQTAPSKRIAGIVRGYRKPIHGPIVTERIGLSVLRERCPHFGEWLRRLEEAAPQHSQ
jgi:hypothetical protein